VAEEDVIEETQETAGLHIRLFNFRDRSFFYPSPIFSLLFHHQFFSRETAIFKEMGSYCYSWF